MNSDFKNLCRTIRHTIANLEYELNNLTPDGEEWLKNQFSIALLKEVLNSAKEIAISDP